MYPDYSTPEDPADEDITECPDCTPDAACRECAEDHFADLAGA